MSDHLNTRKVQVFSQETWWNTEPEMLRVGDVFRLFEPDGEWVKDPDGRFIFQVDAPPYKTEKGIWTIESHSLEATPL